MTFIFPYTGNNHPNWPVFFRGVETTNQKIYGKFGSSSFQLTNSRIFSEGVTPPSSVLYQILFHDTIIKNLHKTICMPLTLSLHVDETRLDFECFAFLHFMLGGWQVWRNRSNARNRDKSIARVTRFQNRCPATGDLLQKRLNKSARIQQISLDNLPFEQFSKENGSCMYGLPSDHIV